LNWTEILLKGGVPEAPGYQELVALIRAEQKESVAAAEGKPAKGKRRKRGKRGGNG